MKKKLIISGGGTAGHIYPAMSIIEFLKINYKDIEIFYIGTEKGMERELILPLGVKFIAIKSSGLLQKSDILKKIKSYIIFIINVFSGFINALKIIKDIKPNAIIGMGGYVCAPVFLACILLRKRFYIHEQNYIPGRLNLIFSKYAAKVFISFSESKRYFKTDFAKIIYSGNPVRQVIRNMNYETKNYNKYGLKPGKFTITAFGGSLGADKINRSFIDLWNIMKDEEGFQYLLISGRRFYDEILKEKSLSNISDYDNLKVISYEDNMHEIYNISDLIISRSGANTVAEISVTGIPAILIPFPGAVNNHQYYNADYLVKNGRALLLDDSETSGSNLKKIIKNMISNDFKLYNELKNKKVDNIFLKSHEIIVENIIGD